MKISRVLLPSMLLAASLLPTTLLPPPSFAANGDDLVAAKRILVLGDSITYGGDYVTDLDCWLQSRGSKAEVLNLGLPSETFADMTATEQQETHIKPFGFPRPNLSERLERVLDATKPDWVFACYGMNDGSSLPQNDEGFKRFCTAVENFRGAAQKHGINKITLLTPPIQDAGPGKPVSTHDAMLVRFSDWLLSKRQDGWDVIDLHGPMRAALDERRKNEPNFRFAGDGVHPGAEGHRLMAHQIIQHFSSPAVTEEVLAHSPWFGTALRSLVSQRMTIRRDAWLTLTKHIRPGLPTGLPLDQAEAKVAEINAKIETQKAQPFPGQKTAWNGFTRYDFPVGANKTCSVIVPAQPAANRLWAWKGEFLDAFPGTEIQLLQRGVHVVYLNAPNLLGAPEAVRHWNDAYDELVNRYGMAPKPALIGLSRGGLYCYNWAIANPNKVACIYADAAVCDTKSWPGGKGKGKGSAADWQLAMKVYGFKDEAEALAYKGNPIDNLKPLADAKIDLIHVYGDADDVVPWDENTGIVAERYRALGGNIQLIAKPGVSHHPHGLADPTPVVDFIIKHLQAANLPQ